MHRVFTKLHYQLSFKYDEKFVLLFMIMPNKFSFQFSQLYVLPIEF